MYSSKCFDSETECFEKDSLNHWLARNRKAAEVHTWDQVTVQSLRNPLKPFTQLHSQFWIYVPVMDIVFFKCSHSAPLLTQLQKEDMNQYGHTDNCVEARPELYWFWCSAKSGYLEQYTTPSLPPLFNNRITAALFTSRSSRWSTY